MENIVLKLFYSFQKNTINPMNINKFKNSLYYIYYLKIKNYLLNKEQINILSILKNIAQSENKYFLLKSYKELDYSALFTSQIHGRGHIERVILYVYLISLKEQIQNKYISILLDAAKYH